MRARLAGLGIGIVFGVILSWSGMTSPVIIRQALLFQRSYLFLFFASAVLTATVGMIVLRRARGRALIAGTPIGLVRERVQRRHITGSLLFGLGWGISDACPGPIATQIGQGIVWAIPLIAGVLIGVRMYLRRHAIETEPATDPASPPSPAVQAA